MNTFDKEERLCSRKLIDLLFKNGSSFLLYPFRVSYLFADASHQFPVQVVINVAKKRFKRAVDRNLIKRRSREAYRLQKQTLLYHNLPESDQLLLLSIQFVGKKIYDYAFFEKKMAGALRRLTTNICPGPATVETSIATAPPVLVTEAKETPVEKIKTDGGH